MLRKFTIGSVGLSRLIAAVPAPVSVTVAFSPLLPAMVNDPVADPDEHRRVRDQHADAPSWPDLAAHGGQAGSGKRRGRADDRGNGLGGRAEVGDEDHLPLGDPDRDVGGSRVQRQHHGDHAGLRD